MSKGITIKIECSRDTEDNGKEVNGNENAQIILKKKVNFN